MKKYVLLVSFILLATFQKGFGDYFYPYYIDSTRWSVCDFGKHPIYGDTSNPYKSIFSICAIDFMDTLHGIADVKSGIVDRYSIMQTNDGGLSWSIVSVDSDYTVNNRGLNILKYLDSDCVFGMYYGTMEWYPIVKFSNDQGKNWNCRNLSYRWPGVNIAGIYNKNFIIIIQSDTSFLVTDKGNKWKPINIDTALVNHYTPSKCIVISPDDIILICHDNIYKDCYIFHSYDTLKTCQKFGVINNHTEIVESDGTIYYGEYSTNFAFADDHLGWYCCNSGYVDSVKTHYDYVYKTEDGGKNWNLQYNKIHRAKQYNHWSYCALNIACCDQFNVVVYGQENKCARSYSGGENWQELIDTSDYNKGKTIDCDYVCYVKPYDIYVVSNKNRIIAHADYDFTDVSEPTKYSSDNDILIYPNPFCNSFNIKDGIGKPVEVYSQEGRLLMNTVYYSPIDLSNFSDGVYFVKIGGRTYRIVKV